MRDIAHQRKKPFSQKSNNPLFGSVIMGRFNILRQLTPVSSLLPRGALLRVPLYAPTAISFGHRQG